MTQAERVKGAPRKPSEAGFVGRAGAAERLSPGIQCRGEGYGACNGEERRNNVAERMPAERRAEQSEVCDDEALPPPPRALRAALPPWGRERMPAVRRGPNRSPAQRETGTQRRPGGAVAVGGGGATKRSGCPPGGGRSRAKFVTTRLCPHPPGPAGGSAALGQGEDARRQAGTKPEPSAAGNGYPTATQRSGRRWGRRSNEAERMPAGRRAEQSEVCDDDEQGSIARDGR